MTTHTEDLLGADTSELTMLGRPVERAEGERPKLECFTTKVSVTREEHETDEWVSECPIHPYLTDIYSVLIVYAPNREGRVLEAKSLREYGASFKNTRAFAEALAGQVAHDVMQATRARWVEVTFRQNVRGGWRIRAFKRLPEPEFEQPEPGQDGG